VGLQAGHHGLEAEELQVTPNPHEAIKLSSKHCEDTQMYARGVSDCSLVRLRSIARATSEMFVNAVVLDEPSDQFCEYCRSMLSTVF
jgi:hypothetical protein